MAVESSGQPYVVYLAPNLNGRLHCWLTELQGVKQVSVRIPDVVGSGPRYSEYFEILQEHSLLNCLPTLAVPLCEALPSRSVHLPADGVLGLEVACLNLPAVA